MWQVVCNTRGGKDKCSPVLGGWPWKAIVSSALHSYRDKGYKTRIGAYRPLISTF